MPDNPWSETLELLDELRLPTKKRKRRTVECAPSEAADPVLNPANQATPLDHPAKLTRRVQLSVKSRAMKNEHISLRLENRKLLRENTRLRRSFELFLRNEWRPVA